MAPVSASPNFISSLWTIIELELTRLFLTQRGLVYLATFGVVWYLILRYFIMGFATQLPDGLGWNVPELAAYWRSSLYLFPILCFFLAANQTVSDRERGTLRFLTLRSSRDSIFFGRFLSQMLIQLFLVSMTLLSAVAAAAWRDGQLLSLGINEAMVIVINLIVVLLPFTAMMAVLSACVNSVRQVTVLAILIWLMASGIIGLLSEYASILNYLKLIIPGYQLSDLSSLSQGMTFELIHIPVLQTIVLLLIGRFVMVRTSL